MRSSYYIKDSKEKYTIIIPNRTKNYISNILKNFDSTDIVKWHESIEKYVNDPLSECWLGNESSESRINSIFKYFQFLHKVNLLEKLYDYYINNVVTENEWYIILSSYDNCSPSGTQGKPIVILEPQPQSDEICDATIRNIIIEDIDNGRLKIHPAGKISNNGEIVFFEYEDTPVVVENNKEPVKSLDDLLVDSMDQALLDSFNDSLVSGILKLEGN